MVENLVKKLNQDNCFGKNDFKIFDQLILMKNLLNMSNYQNQLKVKT